MKEGNSSSKSKAAAKEITAQDVLPGKLSENIELRKKLEISLGTVRIILQMQLPSCAQKALIAWPRSARYHVRVTARAQ